MSHSVIKKLSHFVIKYAVGGQVNPTISTIIDNNNNDNNNNNDKIIIIIIKHSTEQFSAAPEFLKWRRRKVFTSTAAFRLH